MADAAHLVVDRLEELREPLSTGGTPLSVAPGDAPEVAAAAYTTGGELFVDGSLSDL
jgi:hypothetical protein